MSNGWAKQRTLFNEVWVARRAGQLKEVIKGAGRRLRQIGPARKRGLWKGAKKCGCGKYRFHKVMCTEIQEEKPAKKIYQDCPTCRKNDWEKFFHKKQRTFMLQCRNCAQNSKSSGGKTPNTTMIENLWRVSP